MTGKFLKFGKVASPVIRWMDDFTTMITPTRRKILLRSFSLTHVLLDLMVSSFDTIIANNSVRYKQRWQSCDNKRKQHLVALNNYKQQLLKTRLL